MYTASRYRYVDEYYQNHPLEDRSDARLSKDGLTPQQREHTWSQLRDNLFSHQRSFLGFQSNQDFNSEKVKPFLDIGINNDGDPFSVSSLNALNTKTLEVAVLDYFASLWRIQQCCPLNEKDRAYWGYITSMGSTESNHLALYNAREYLSGMPLSNPHLYDDDVLKTTTVKASDTSPEEEKLASSLNTEDNAFTPVVFFSEESYHGLTKTLRMLQMKTFCQIGSGNFPCPLKYPDDYPECFSEESLDQNRWPHAVPVEADGSISIPCLVKLVTAFSMRGYPPVVVFTSGTTFKGAYDNPKAAINGLLPILKRYGMYKRRVCFSQKPFKSDIRNGFWFHIDGALGATYLPFLEMAINQGLIEDMFPNGFPVFDFRIPEVKSIATSLHKWFTCPFPGAIFMIRKMDQVKAEDHPLFIGGQNYCLSGSRNGHAAIVMWDLFSRKSYKDFTEIALAEEKMVKFAHKNLHDLQEELLIDLEISHSPGSLFVCFKQPRQDIVRRYSLGSNTLKVKSVDGTYKPTIYSHICLMPHVTENQILCLMNELRTPGAFPD